MTGDQESVHNALDSIFATSAAQADEGCGDEEMAEPMVDADDDRAGQPGNVGSVEMSPPGLDDAITQRDEYLDSLRRLQAEFENYKKRVDKQQIDQRARAALMLVEKLLPVLDTLDLATAHIGDAESDDGRALLAVSSQLRDVLAKEGLERIDPMGEEFDPNAHEAVGHMPDEPGVGSDDGADGQEAGQVAARAASGEPVVAQVMRPGYRWQGAVVRPAMVMVRG
jgi:molecular chaperone GrpE